MTVLNAQILEAAAMRPEGSLLADRPAGQAIRALTWLGPDQASAAIPELRRVLPPVEWVPCSPSAPSCPTGWRSC
jgi:hypothetical protein